MKRILPVLFAILWSFPAGAQQPAASAPPSSEANRAPGNYADVAGAKIYYEECGAGAPVNVVLLHDGLLHSVTWDEVWTPLCAKYHVLRYDRRGYGRTQPASAPFVPEDDLFQLMKFLNMKRAIIAGNSSGGGLALDFALAHPEMVEGLFLIGPVVHGMPSSAYFVERGQRNSAPLAQNDAKGAAENWSRDPYLISGDNPAARKKFFEALAANPQNLAVPGQFEIRPSPPAVLRLSQIQAPALVLVGDADIADVIAYCGAIEAALPIVVFEVWKGSGHLIQLEHPDELVTRFQRFAVLADRVEAKVSANVLRDYTGEYKFLQRTIGISLHHDRLWLRLPDTPEKPLFSSSESRFFVRTTPTEFQFERDASGKIAKLVIYNSDGSKLECPRP